MTGRSVASVVQLLLDKAASFDYLNGVVSSLAFPVLFNPRSLAGR
jgi:predicted membrane-bound spermidine synthase